MTNSTATDVRLGGAVRDRHHLLPLPGSHGAVRAARSEGLAKAMKARTVVGAPPKSECAAATGDRALAIRVSPGIGGRGGTGWYSHEIAVGADVRFRAALF